MRRREFMGVLSSAVMSPVAALTYPWPSLAQDKNIPHVGVLTPADSAETPIFDAFRNGLRDLEYVEGRTIALEFRFAKGNYDALPSLARELVELPVDIIVTDTSTAALAAAGATRTIPIVMGIGAGDPVKMGLVASLAHPAGNVTGMTLGATELNGKRLELIKQAFPDAAHVAVLTASKNTAAQTYRATVEDAARVLGVRLTIITVSDAADLARLSPSDLTAVEALAVLPDAMFWNNRGTIIALAEEARVPAIYPEREYADDGGLIAYGPNVPNALRRAAGYVDRILRGAIPGELPIDDAAKFDFVINLRTAHKLGLNLPPNFLARADEVIE